MLVLLSLLTTTVVCGSQVTDCPCVPPWMCGTTPYGSHALDIATFGLIPECPVPGTVRCCPRGGPEKMLNSPNSIEELSEPSTDSNNMDVECDCVPQGICLENFVTANGDCHESEELCCIPNSNVNAAVELFIDELVDNGDSENTDELPLLDSSINDDEINVNVYGNHVTDCPCVPQWMCGTHGSHALDIATFGLIPACPVPGTVRCCPRDDAEKMLNSQNAIKQLSEPSADSNDTDVECDCLPQGICLENFVTANSDCHESEELCCMPNSVVNAAVELFNDELVDNVNNENTDALPLLDSTINDNIVTSHSKPQELLDEHGTDDDTDDHALPCVPGLMCAKLYGFHPLDVARFGALPHCSQRGLVRCVETKAPISSQSHLFTHEEGYHDAYILPCVLLHKCDKVYGFDPFDIAKFGALPHCARHGFARCVQVKDSTGATSSTSPSVILSDTQAESSSPSSPSVLSDTQAESASVSSSLILSNLQAQPTSPADYQTDQNGNQDFSSSEMQNVEDQGNSNDDERAAAVGDLNAIKVSMDDVALDDEFKEYTPILLDGNNHISEGVNLQVLIPTDLIGTDIHRLIRNHLSLRIGSNPSPGSTEMGQKSDHLSMKDRINSVDPDIVSIITEVIRSNKLIKQDNVQDPSEFVKPYKEDHSSLNTFESVSFKEIIPNQNDQSHPTQMDHVKDPENNLEYSPK